MHQPVCCVTPAMHHYAFRIVSRKTFIPRRPCAAGGVRFRANASSVGMAAAAGMDTSDAPAGLGWRRFLLPCAQRRCRRAGIAVQLLRVHVV